MTNCNDEGRLRAYLDGELPAAERAAIRAHIAGCGACQTLLAEQRAAAGRVRELLPPPPGAPSPHAALAEFHRRAEVRASTHTALGLAQGATTGKEKAMHTAARPSGRRNLFAAIALAVVLLSLLALPPVRAAADQLLSIFRVQRVVFVPVSADRVRQLEQLNVDGQALFVGSPQTEGRGEPRTVASAAEAASAMGYAVAEPTKLPSQPLNTEYAVLGAGKGEFQVNVAIARQILQDLGVTDVDIPDALGNGPIKVDIPPFVAAHYRGAGYDLTLNQGRSPNVTLPDGVDLAQLGTAALRVLGMTPEQAEAASRDIDWNGTLLFPFPANTDNIRQVTVGGESGLLVGAGSRGDQHYQLYWQRGDRFYMLEGRGSASDESMIGLLIATAESVQ
jgi:anti-sigma factor RsiW